MTITSINPATNETVKVFEPITKGSVMNAIRVAHTAYQGWRETTFDRRKACLQKFADLLRADADEYARKITLEMGKRISESEYEIEYCAKIAEFYANGAEQFLADETINVEGVDAYMRHQPLGVLLGVMPWNFPFYQVVRFAAPNIMAGNTVMVKHASNVPQCAAALEELFCGCGLPGGVYTNLFIPSEMVEAIVSDSRIQGVSLTGSEPAGAAVAAVAGKNLKRSVLELGGNDPFIVLEDADLGHTIQQAVKGRIVNAGQSCVASKRSVFTADIERGRRVAEQVETGMMFVNRPTQSQSELPFGGIKNSGYGRELSHLGILEFINKKLIHLGGKK